MPHPSELSVVTENPDFMEKSALALCERLLLPKKLAGTLISSFKEALAGGPGPKADEMLQKVYSKYCLNFYISSQLSFVVRL